MPAQNPRWRDFVIVSRIHQPALKNAWDKLSLRDKKSRLKFTSPRKKQVKIKNSAIIYTGYDYQTLQGVKLLAEWLQSPTKYLRIAFEADQDTNDAPTGIDDIVCEYPDGTRDYWQVKFTPSPYKDENRLTWSWLLKITGKTKRSRSILKKINDAAASIPQEKIGKVILLTNKLPGRDIESCISGSKIDINKINEEIKNDIITQIGSEKAAKDLFSMLTIQHSEGNYQVLNRNLRNELLKFSDSAGVERLISRSREWAFYKNNPPRDGWIELHHIREVLSPKRPEPIPELFEVPNDYRLPDSDFHDRIMTRITTCGSTVITLTGNPGSGKSTYLSYLCQKLKDRQIPIIRHHYFLSLADPTFDRLSPRIVAESLLYQINRYYKGTGADTSEPEKLHNAIKTCANYYKSEGKPFVVLIDGLDHVWRDNAKNKKPLDEIFKQILITTENLVVLVGTQPVDDALIPTALLSKSPKQDWYWLPKMTGNSIFDFLKLKVETNRLFTECHQDLEKDEIQRSAKAIMNITNGYPLHVIYLTEYLSKQGIPLSERQISKLPQCQGDNITSYYQELWNSLSYKQKDVLHLSCGFKFPWPRQAIGKILKDTPNDAPSVNAVAHLLSETISGVRPYHESLVVFVNNLPDHQDRIDSLLSDVCDWLRRDAPSNLKDDWLWSCEALAGDSTNLRKEVTRDWVLDRLTLGMTVNACIRLLSEAEAYAFNDKNYAEAYRHSALKTRLINGPEFETTDQSTLEILSLIGADRNQLNDIISRTNELSPQKLSILGIAMWHREEVESAKHLSNRAISRHKSERNLLPSNYSQEEVNEVSLLLYSGTLTDSLNYDTVFREDVLGNWPDEYIFSLRAASLAKKDIELLIKIWECLSTKQSHRKKLELDIIRLGIIEGAEIKTWPQYHKFSSSNLVKFSEIYEAKAFKNLSTADHKTNTTSIFRLEINESYHSRFFCALNQKITASGDFCWVPIHSEKSGVDISKHYNILNSYASIAGRELTARNKLNFSLVCSLFKETQIIEDDNWRIRKENATFKREWIEISADCHLVTTGSKISSDELKNVLELGIFNSRDIRLWYKDSKLDLLSDDAVEILIKHESLRYECELEETIEISQAYLDLAQLSLQHNLQKHLGQSLKTAWDVVLGYGYHKDSNVFEVLNAIEHLSEVNPKKAFEFLERISPIVYNISDFTDGDETRHSRYQFTKITSKLSFQTLASMYEQNLIDGEWYCADNTINALVERDCFSSIITGTLYLTGLPEPCYELLKKHVNSTNVKAKEFALRVNENLGINLDEQLKDLDSRTIKSEKELLVDPDSYPISSIEDLSKLLDNEVEAKEFIIKWYQHWQKRGKELELVQQLLPYFSDTISPSDVKIHLLDLLFHSIKKLKGKSKAFEILVLAQNALFGWLNWYESKEQSLKRLAIVAREYPKKIDTFIKLTTKQTDAWKDIIGNLIIPSDKLVFLLLKGGRHDEALELTLSMVDELENSVRNLKLVKPTWVWDPNDFIEEALLKVLISRLKHPLTSVKLWAAEQTASLLCNKNLKLEELLKQDLSKRNQESECIEVLCVFYIAHLNGYKCPLDLGKHIKARSILSDILLETLTPNSVDLGKNENPITPLVSASKNNHRFNYFQGRDVPLNLKNLLSIVEDYTGIPFTCYYEEEWINTFKYLPSSRIEINYFLGSEWQRTTGFFYTQASHRGRSAYLRTIEQGKLFYGIPKTDANNLSIFALPIEPAYIGLKPKKPNWLPEWHSSVSVNISNLTSFINQSLESFKSNSNDQELLAFSFPIRINDNNWIDLSVVKTTDMGNSANLFPEEEDFECTSFGDLLNPELTFKFKEISNNHSLALAVKPTPMSRYGHWHSDIQSRDFFVPRPNISDREIIGKTSKEKFGYFIDDSQIGFSSYWFSSWKPRHPRGVKSLCGSYTVVFNQHVTKWRKQPTSFSDFPCICRANILSSDNSYTNFNLRPVTFFIRSEHTNT